MIYRRPRTIGGVRAQAATGLAGAAERNALAARDAFLHAMGQLAPELRDAEMRRVEDRYIQDGALTADYFEALLSVAAGQGVAPALKARVGWTPGLIADYYARNLLSNAQITSAVRALAALASRGSSTALGALRRIAPSARAGMSLNLALRSLLLLKDSRCKILAAHAIADAAPRDPVLNRLLETMFSVDLNQTTVSQKYWAAKALLANGINRQDLLDFLQQMNAQQRFLNEAVRP